MIERDAAKELQAGSGCFFAIAIALGLSTWATYASLVGGSEEVHPLIWPAWKIGGNMGVLVFGSAVTLVCLGIAVFARIRAVRTMGE